MDTWDIKFHDGTYASGIEAIRSAEALQKAAPNFKWAAGVRIWDRHSYTMKYSGMEGSWAEVVKATVLPSM